MISLKKLSPTQKERLESLISDARIRLKDASLPKQSRNTQAPQQPTKPDQADSQFLAHDFVKMIYFMLREGLYGIESDDGTEQTTEINYDILQKNFNFIYSTFEFPKIDSTQPRIKAFEQIQTIKDQSGLFEKVVQKIQRLAVMVFISIQDYLSYNYHSKLISCPESEKMMYLSRLYNILEDIEKNYTWDRWKKEQILSEIMDQKESLNRAKQLEEMHISQILYISSSRQALNQLRLKNTTLQSCIQKAFKNQLSSKSQQQIRKLKSFENKAFVKSKKMRHPSQGQEAQQLLKDIDTPEIEASIQELIKVQKRLQAQSGQEREEQTVRISKTESQGAMNYIHLTRLSNIQSIAYFMKKEENERALNQFLEVLQKAQGGNKP